RPLVTYHYRVGDVRAELEMVLPFRRRDVLATSSDDDVLHAVRDVVIAILVDAPYVTCVQPAIDQGFSRLFGLIQISHENGRAANQYFALVGKPDFRSWKGSADTSRTRLVGCDRGA